MKRKIWSRGGGRCSRHSSRFTDKLQKSNPGPVSSAFLSLSFTRVPRVKNLRLSKSWSKLFGKILFSQKPIIPSSLRTTIISPLIHSKFSSPRHPQRKSIYMCPDMAYLGTILTLHTYLLYPDQIARGKGS